MGYLTRRTLEGSTARCAIAHHLCSTRDGSPIPADIDMVTNGSTCFNESLEIVNRMAGFRDKLFPWRGKPCAGRPYPVGEAHHRAKLSNAEVKLIREMVEQGMSRAAAARQFDVDRTH